MEKPTIKVFDSFSEFIESRKADAVQGISDAQQTLKKGWYQPTNSEETSSLDVQNIPEKFNRDDIQEAYVKYITSDGFPAEATSIKIQNGFIAGEEQAYRVRHTSLPRALAQGYMENLRWSNETIPYLLINHIKVLGDMVDKNFTDRMA